MRQIGHIEQGGVLAHRNHQGVEMRQKSATRKEPAEKVVKDIRRATRKRHSSEEKIRVVLEGLRGEDSVERTSCRPLDQPYVPPATMRLNPP
jgi:hypothetical protein